MLRPTRAHRAIVPFALLVFLASGPRLGTSAPRSVHPALSNVRPGEGISERFLSRDRNGGVLVDLLIEGDITPGALRGHGIEVNSHIGRRMTARCPLPLLSQLLALPGIERVEVAERCKPNLDRSGLDVGVNTLRTVTPPSFTGQTGAGVLIGDVDTGIDYLHPDFLHDDGTTRLVSIWDQTGSGASPPAGFSYGAEWLPAQINAGIPAQVDDEGHGTHVMGIAAGNGSATGNGEPAYTYVGMAPEADICMVKTNFTTTSIVDGVNYIFQKAAALGKRAVVNLSLGTQEGPHDGTLDMDQMLNALTGPGKIIVASAGNEGAEKLHGQLTLSGATPQNMTLTVPAYTAGAGTGDDFLLFSGWYAGTSQISLTITTPTGVILGPVLTGTNLLGQNTLDGWLDIHNGTSTPTNGAHEIYVQLYDAVTARPPKNGTWTFTLTPVSIPGGGRVDMYLYENHLAGGGGPYAVWNQGLAFGGVVASPGDADSVITVAAHATKDCWDAVDGLNYCWSPHPTLGAIAFFSSQGPRRDGALKPDLSAPGFGVTSSLSSADFNASPSLTATDGVHVNFAGTSMAAPHVAGGTALLLARSEWANATPSGIKARLLSTARVDAFTGAVPNATWGYGKLDLGTALAIPLTVLVSHPAKGNLYVIGKYDSVNVVLTGFTADSITFALSQDGGATYPKSLGTLYNVPSGPPAGLTFFVDPSMASSQAKVRAVAQHGASVLTSFSDSLFMIGIPVGVVEETPVIPLRFALSPNTPNPFNPVTTIRFELNRPGPALLRVYSISGALVRTLVEKQLPAGRFRAQWDGRDSAGRPVGSGIYIYRLTQGGRNLSRKMSLLK
jgi:subtilisin family serine protease